MSVPYLIFSFTLTFVLIITLSILNLSLLHLTIPLVWLWWMIQNSILYIIQPYLIPNIVLLFDIILYFYQFAFQQKQKIPNHLLIFYIIVLTLPIKYEKSATEMTISVLYFVAHLFLFPSIPAAFCCLFSSSYSLYYIVLGYIYYIKIEELMVKVHDVEAYPKHEKWNFVMLD